MSKDSVLARGRLRYAQVLLKDTCVVRRPGATTTDDLTGETVTAGPTTIYTGPCRVQTSGTGAMGNRTDAGEVSVVVLRLELQLPVVGSEGVRRGDEVTITAATHDQDLLSRLFKVRDLQHKTDAAARHLQMDEVT